MKHYPDYYGCSVVLIGKSSQGQPLEPVLVDSIVTAVEVFGNGELVNAAREVLGAGAEYLYLVRVISDNKRDLYYELKELYELFENMVDIDIIVPLGIKLADYIIDYPDLFRVSQEFIYNGNPVLETGRIIQDVNLVRVNGLKTQAFSLRSHDSGAFDAIILNTKRFNLKEGDTIIVDYNTVNNIDAEIELLAFRNNKIEDSIILSSTIDVNKKVNKVTEKPVKDYFSLEGENVKYIVRTKIPFLKVYTNKSGKEKAYAEFDYNEYIANNTVYKYFARELAEACSRINAIGLLKPDNKDYHKLIEDSMRIREELDSITDYGKYILSIPSDCRYESGTGEYSSPYLTAFAGLLGTLPTGISPTNRGTKGVTGIDDNFTNLEIKSLSHYGHIVLYNSVRRGVAPYKAVTMARDDSPYRSVKNIRVANEVAKRVKSITDSFIGRWTANVETKLKDLLTALFESLVIEGKIREYSFEITEVRTDYIKIELELKLYNEINNIRTGVISTI